MLVQITQCWAGVMVSKHEKGEEEHTTPNKTRDSNRRKTNVKGGVQQTEILS